MEAYDPYKLNYFHKEYHLAAPLPGYMRENGVPIDIPRGMDKEDLHRALKYGSHYSDLKERSFVQKDITQQLKVGHVTI